MFHFGDNVDRQPAAVEFLQNGDTSATNWWQSQLSTELPTLTNCSKALLQVRWCAAGQLTCGAAGVVVRLSIKDTDGAIAQAYRLVSHFRSCALSALSAAGRRPEGNWSSKRLVVAPGNRRVVTWPTTTLEFTSGRANRQFIAHAQNFPEVRH